MGVKCDFSGWATKNNLRCADGRTIRRDAFKDNDGQTVPLVWQHQHNDPENVLGHALLENREDGVYTYGVFNNTEMGQRAKELVDHGDITHLSIYANKLKQIGTDVIHGAIREVSLVLAGANPGALIDSDSIAHSIDSEDDDAIIYTGELIHMETNEKTTELQHAEAPAEGSGKTVKDVFDSMTEEQKNVVYFMIGQALEDAGVNPEGEDVEHGDLEGDDFMKHNVFEGDFENNQETLSHSEFQAIVEEAKANGSLKNAFIAHGIENIGVLFPEARAESNTPELYNGPDEWVAKVIGAIHKSPFAKIKNMWSDITPDQARALGYVKGTLKKEEVISVLKRETSPQTIYKKQKLDRDDIIDITDFDVVAWLKNEMNIKMKEELARAALFGDGREPEDEDKINPEHVRPIASEHDMFATTVTKEFDVRETSTDIELRAAMAKAFMDAVIEHMDEYRGSGNPTLYTCSYLVSGMLLLEDGFGRKLYKSKTELADALGVKEIVILPFLTVDSDSETGITNVCAIIVNLNDYTFGSDKGGELNFFDDFDIDYNQMKYLLETRISGSLRKLKSAVNFNFKPNVIKDGQG